MVLAKKRALGLLNFFTFILPASLTTGLLAAEKTDDARVYILSILELLLPLAAKYIGQYTLQFCR